MIEALWIAVALVMVIEGIGPMLFPNKWQNYLKHIACQPVEQLRTVGGIMVIIGCVSLFFLL